MSVEAIGLTKVFGSKTAVNDLSFTLEPGVVTGFSGQMVPGKSTTMRLMLGLDRGDGETRWDGKKLTEHKHATKGRGAHLDARFFNPNRTARAHCECSPPKRTCRIRASMSAIDPWDSRAKRRSAPRRFRWEWGNVSGSRARSLRVQCSFALTNRRTDWTRSRFQWLRDFLGSTPATETSCRVQSPADRNATHGRTRRRGFRAAR